MIVENEYRIKLSDINRENKATNKAILSYLEDVGGKHSDLAGYGILDIPQTHLSWIIIEWKLRVIRRPNYGEKIKATTWSKNAIRCYAYRDFKVYDEQGNVIILASSKWVLVDTIKGKIVRIDDELLKKYQPELDMFAFDSQNEDFPKMREPDKYQSEVEYKVRKADIDVNDHMHNLNYVDLANEALPEEVYNKGNLNNIRITYKKEIKLGETVNCKYSFENGKHFVVVKSQDDKSIHALVELYN